MAAQKGLLDWIGSYMSRNVDPEEQAAALNDLERLSEMLDTFHAESAMVSDLISGWISQLQDAERAVSGKSQKRAVERKAPGAHARYR
jgi:hypothetical protein